MYIIMWEYLVKTDRSAVFEETYSASGVWTQLLRKGAGFLETELLRDQKNPYHYITIDRWTSSQDYESFLSEWKEEYESLDVQCEGFTEQENLLGKWESLNDETR